MFIGVMGVFLLATVNSTFGVMSSLYNVGNCNMDYWLEGTVHKGYFILLSQIY